MSKVIISLIDVEDGKISCDCTPNAPDLLTKHKSEQGLSPAEALAVYLLNCIHKYTTENEAPSPIARAPRRKLII